MLIIHNFWYRNILITQMNRNHCCETALHIAWEILLDTKIVELFEYI